MHLPLLDPVKAVAAQVIVLHHLMLYSSMRGPLEAAFPTVVGFLADPARYAVQVFLVISGFLTFQSLQRWVKPQPDGSIRPMRMDQFWQGLFARYKRLARPYALALLLAVIALAWIQDFNPVTELSAAHPEQMLAHLLLLHGVLGIDSLSAGVWYVAIDFQLFALSLFCALVASQVAARLGWNARRTLLMLLGGLTVSALFVFNLQTNLDAWGLFFFGSYGLGMLACWAVQSDRKAEGFAVAGVLVTLALALAYRERLWVTLATTGFLLLAPQVQTLPAWMNSRLMQFFNQSSYPLFLVHYPLSILLFALIEDLYLQSLLHNAMAAGFCLVVFWMAAKLLMSMEALVFDRAPSYLTFRHTIFKSV